MWSPIVFCFLVGFAFAANNPAWKEGSEYVYQIRGRSLVNHAEISNRHAGFVFKAYLRIQPQNNGNLRGQISNAQYDEIHSDLPQWDSHIPEDQLSWKPLKMSNKPFEAQMDGSRIVDLSVSKLTPVWEANMIKSIMSQFQINTEGANLIKNKLNTFSDNENGDNNAVFTTMEDTITGNTETLYEIRPLPKHMVQSEPKEAHYLDAAENGDVIEVIKHKNYDNNMELPAYSFGFQGLKWGKPGHNQMGNFLVRDSISRIILTGDLKHFVIRKAFTVNEIYVSPSLNEEKTTVGGSRVNATLEKITSPSQPIPEVPQPIQLGNLVYSYEKPYSQNNEVEAKIPYEFEQYQENEYSSEESRENYISKNSMRHPRSIRRIGNDEPQHAYKQDLPELKEAPESPLLPFTMGYESMSIKRKINVVEEVRKLAQEIGKKMQEPERDHHEQLLDMFTTMVSLIRTMDYQELQQAANQLYSNNKHGLERAIWSCFRDAVAQSGTGPALLIVKEWIQTDKMWCQEASQALTTLVNNARQPTNDFFHTLFEVVKHPKVQKEWPLNDTSLLDFSELIRRVYVNEEEFKEGFPVKSFKPFRTDEGEQFIKNEVFQYYEQELEQAVERAESHRIHALIQAIGKTGSYHALSIFEPYLEGKKPVTSFQRTLMVLSMEKLAETHDEIARNVLFRIYQNPGEAREVRIAAVFQLMRTWPNADMLKLMAQNTHVDADDYVNSVVKTAIETAAQLDRPEFAELYKAAQAAQSYLTEKPLGVHYGGSYFRTYFIEELQKTYKQVVQVFGSDDQMFPKGIRYSLAEHMSGFKTRMAYIQALISSVDDLLQVGREQTEEYQREEKQQREQNEEQEQNQWSSLNVAKVLNLQPEDAEQLEGFFLIELGNYRNMFGFDNRTINDLSEAIRYLEEELNKEKELSYYKLTAKEMAIAIPTEFGTPLLFTYDVPMFIKAQGKISAKAQPQLSQSGKIYAPEQIQFASDMKMTLSTKVQSRLSIISPFNHKQYFAGYDKHLQLNVPARTQMSLDVNNKNAHIEFELKPTNEHNLFHYATRPFTCVVDVTNFEPMTAQPTYKLIKQQNLQGFKTTVGKKSTGMAFEVEMTHSRKFLDTLNLVRNWQQQGFAGIAESFRAQWEKEIEYGLINVNWRPEESSTRKVVLRLSYDEKYQAQPESGSSSEWILKEDVEPAQRQEELMRKIASDIKNVQVVSLDSSVEFKGNEKIKYILTGAVAKSNVDPKSRVMVSYKRSSNGSPKPHEFHFDAQSYIPNTNALDLEYTLQNEPMAETEIKVKFGNSQESFAKFEAQLKLRRSNERKQYLKQLPTYKQCKEELKEGNKQMPTCLNMTMIANLLDSVELKAHYENLKPELLEAIQRYYQALQVYALPSLEIKNQDTSLGKNEIKMQARFHPDLQAVNITVQSQKQESIFKNIEVDEVSQQIFVVHPVFHVSSRLYGLAHLDNYRSSCVVDKTQINTFSNLTYPADISKHWTVMLQYINGNSRKYQESVQQQLKSQPENFVVLVRENPESANKKDIKIVVSGPETEFKPVEVQLTPSGSKPKVTVNGQEINVNEKESHDVKQGYIQIYALPNQEVKVDVDRQFYIIYDGHRARISTTEGKFRKNIVGICGQFTDIVNDDLTTPQACVARDFEEFVQSFEMEGEKGKQIRQVFQGKTNKCVEKDIPLYTDVISPRDYRSNEKQTQSNTCTYFQTKYVQENGELCFTIRAQPTCNSQCRPRRQITKNVAVHCVKQNSHVANLWKKQIDNRSSPDFSGQRAHMTVKMTVPETCVQ